LVPQQFDLSGMGDDHTSASEVSLDSYAARVCEVLAADSEPAVVVGHSMGGILERKERHDVPNMSRRSYTWRPSLKRGSTEKISQRLEGTETVLADRVTAEVRLRARAPARPGLRSS
jgi:hypothetical protein